ncbi:AdoMet-dependent rRNA methyltransferase spb-1 [Tothia fuscella]|uniref:AdoMet-dependent rRNA methyltransferase spb-1 n=1 Tax=Tothia fuscella TaxID=1048955 RepID=A0A9P4TUL8_9PEZI|nr:AdoMet-dependent rRNA methyltransferase spb-1 [Tothia fuscella]
MAIQKKHGKGRLDKWYKLAKEKGYRARAAFKLIQLNKKYHFLEKSKVIIDLCAAPGSWCQVASEVCPASALIIGVDLAPIKAIPRCITFQSDITTDKCRATLRGHLKTWKADTVLHDGAPNVGTAWVQDSFNQAELVLQSLKLATDFLAEGGTFVTKIFRSKDYNSLLWVFHQLFMKVEATKPPSSRNVSAEIFVVCRGYKAPKRIDPKFLDPRSVFAELADPTPNNEAKVFNPEKKKRKRQGYEEGDWLQFKEAPASEFIQTTDPIAMLGSLNKLSLEEAPNGDIALATLNKLPETTQEIRDCCADLKVLGRKDFKLLLRWRLKVREIFGFASKKKEEEEKAKEAEDENVEIESMDEEMKVREDLQRMKDGEGKKKRKERRKENEQKRKDIVRMQMNMTTPKELGLEQAGPLGEDGMFALKVVDKAGAINQVVRGKMHTIVESKPEVPEEENEDSDSDGDLLERQLDAMYDQYQEKKMSVDTKYRAKRARKEHEDGEWHGFSENSDQSDDDQVMEDEDSDDSSDEDEGPGTLVTDLEQETNGTLTRRAKMFFEQDIFKGIDGLDGLENIEDDDSGIEIEDESDEAPQAKIAIQGKPTHLSQTIQPDLDSDSEPEKTFEVVKRTEEENWDEGRQSSQLKNGRPDIDIITAEAMTLAHQLATGQLTKAEMMDNGFNRYSLRDVDGLPEWFLDDEGRHSRLQRPTTKAAANAIKEKLRAYNARPIKKVREAHARKKFKAAQRLEKLKKKSAMLVEDEGMSEGDKSRTISKMLAKAAKKRPKRQVRVVVARGGNRGISGRPKGTKGKYKMVDGRLKKDVRAQKRLKKKMGGK